MIRAAVLAVVLWACASSAPSVGTPVYMAPERPACHLPPLPEPAMVAGFPIGAPSDLTLAVTRSDAAELQRELAGMRAWIAAAAECIHGGP